MRKKHQRLDQGAPVSVSEEAEPTTETAETATTLSAGAPQNPAAVIAVLVTLASVIFTTWSVYDLLAPHAPALVALTAGAGLELVWLFALATEYQQAKGNGRVDSRLSATGWVLAAVTAVVIFVHGALTAWPLVVLAALPLAAKAGWHLRTRAQAAETRNRLETEQIERSEQQRQEREAAEAEQAERAEAQRREQALSSALSEEQEAELAALEQQTEYLQRRTEKELALEDARAQAEQQKSLAEIRRRAEQQMAVDEGAADIEVRRLELSNRIRLAQPVYSVTELGEGVPDDASSLGSGATGGFATSCAGFGSALGATARAGTGADQQAPGVPVGSGTHQSAAEAEANRRRVAQVYTSLLKTQDAEPSIAEVARQAGLSDRAAGRHLRALGLRD